MQPGAERMVRELARTAEARCRPAQAASLLGLAELMRSGEPALLAAAGALWREELSSVSRLTRLLGDSWQSEDALHAGLCLRACQAVQRWFDEAAASQGVQ